MDHADIYVSKCLYINVGILLNIKYSWALLWITYIYICVCVCVWCKVDRARGSIKIQNIFILNGIRYFFVCFSLFPDKRWIGTLVNNIFYMSVLDWEIIQQNRK